MDEIQPLTRERIDDVPILLAQLERMQVANLLDQHFLTHGNWQGLSLGTVSVVWLSHILSEGDHWLNHVEPWAKPAWGKRRAAWISVMTAWPRCWIT